MKKTLIIIMAMIFALSLASCGGSSEPSYVTYEDYQKISEQDWQHMTPDDFTELLGVEGVERENSLGEGYKTFMYPGEVEDTGILVTFNDLDGDGKYYSNAFSQSGLN